MSPTQTGATAAASSHAARFAVKVPQHDGSANTYYVHDCSCGWQSPLCQDAARAEELYDKHREIQSGRLRIVAPHKKGEPEGSPGKSRRGKCTS